MSYTKHTWTDGETITAAKLNNIENGIEAGASGDSGLGFMTVTVDFNAPGEPINYTWQELYDASTNSTIALVNSWEDSGDTYSEYGEDISFIDFCYYDIYNNTPGYPYCVAFGNGEWFFNCASRNEYPCGYHND